MAVVVEADKDSHERSALFISCIFSFYQMIQRVRSKRCYISSRTLCKSSIILKWNQQAVAPKHQKPTIATLMYRKGNWQASEANETLSGVYKFELVRYMCICMEVHMP